MISSISQYSAKPKYLFQLSSSYSLRSQSTIFSSIQFIKKLRETTGAPIVECKKAMLADGVDGDYTKAIEWLRKSGSATAVSKLAGRETYEGLVGIAISTVPDDDTDSVRDVGSIVRVVSETDFASRSPSFLNLVKIVADGAIILRYSGMSDTSLSKSSIVKIDNLLGTSVGNKTVKDVLDETILAIRENLHIVSATTLVASGSNAILAGYVHGKMDSTALAGSAASIVELVPTKESSGKMSKEEICGIGKKLAMHIVAAKPKYLSPLHVPTAILDKEKEILIDQMVDSGKSSEILDRIVSGRLQKFFEQVCLTEQAHLVEEGNPKISKMMNKLGLEVARFESSFIP